MKNFLKYAGACAALLGLIGFILLMATPGVHAKITIGITFEGAYDGIKVIFGNSDDNLKLAWTALVAWILILVALVILLAGVILPLVKVTALDKVAGLLNMVAVGALIVAGILIFVSAPALSSANEWASGTKVYLEAGWVVAGILSLLGGLVAVAPTVVNLLEKK